MKPTVSIYLLIHSRKTEEDAVSSMIIGFYSSAKRVGETIKRYRLLPGFRDYPDDFMTEEYEIPGSDRSLETVYFLQHEYTLDGYDFVTRIGIFPSLSEAQKAKERMKREDPRYRSYPGGIYPPDGFTVDAYGIDQDHWTEGFVESP